MSSFNAHPVVSSQYGGASHADAFLIGIHVPIADLKVHRPRLELIINGKSSNDHKDHARGRRYRPR
jgi:hypothetical protein